MIETEKDFSADSGLPTRKKHNLKKPSLADELFILDFENLPEGMEVIGEPFPAVLTEFLYNNLSRGPAPKRRKVHFD